MRSVQILVEMNSSKRPRIFLDRMNVYQKMISNAKKILIETDCTETLILRTAPRLTRFHCPECVQEVAMLDLNSAVTISGRGARELIRDLEAGELHSWQTSDGHLLICWRSLTGILWDQTPTD